MKETLMTEPTENPFRAADDADRGDMRLALAAAAGDRAALETLVRKHQRWVYAIAVRMMLSPADAADVAQEALLRVITRIGQYEGRSSFRTWAYRIVTNCFMDARRGRLEGVVTRFDRYGEELDNIPLADLEGPPSAERTLLVEEAKLGCMLGMLLCLDREQRLAFVLGEIFECPSPLAAEILDITPVAFRKRLERARTDLSAFMQEKCGLMNPSNPCRCERKTKGFIAAGWVDPQHLKFTAAHVQRVREDTPRHARALDILHDERAGWLFREHPMLDGPDVAAKMTTLLKDEAFQHALKLDAH
jgi:RNA polymerase sigma factor (sigma-70 family)